MNYADALAIAVNVTRFYLPYELTRYFVAAGVIAGLVWLIKRTPWRSRQIQPRLPARKDRVREIASSLRTCLVYLLVAIPLAWAMHAGLLSRDAAAHSLGYILLLLAAMIVGHDAYFYWTHRAMHTRWLYKTFHRHHHRSVTPSPWTAYSFATPEAFVNALYFPLWLSLVATPHVVTFSFLGVQIFRNTVAHAGLELHPRWWLRTPLTSWISTTTHHDLHHNGAFQHNYGFWFTYWDRLMGTEHPQYREVFARVTASARDPQRNRLPQPAGE
ncbi:MAG: sterol desaturase family protein [Pseudomonadota bacterium]|jgi:sterol desaturase/sphingolipid hydroxylase (fatty acid hydroxylase superfamily)